MSLFSVEQVKLEAACASVTVWRDGLVLGCTNGVAYTVTKNDDAWEVTIHTLVYCALHAGVILCGAVSIGRFQQLFRHWSPC